MDIARELLKIAKLIAPDHCTRTASHDGMVSLISRGEDIDCWPAVNQFRRGDLVSYTLTEQDNMFGVVTGVDIDLNKVNVWWRSGKISQHDPEEIGIVTWVDDAIRRRYRELLEIAEADGTNNEKEN